jgi:RND family efflux transporter MFP subunit
MKRGFCVYSLIVVLLLISSSDPGRCEQAKDSRPPSPVEIGNVRAATVKSEITLLGDVEAFTEGDVHSEVAGLVETFPVKEGDFVREGQVLAELNSSQLDLELERTKSEVQEARVLFEKEERERKRFNMLSKSKSVAAHEFEREVSEAESAKFRMRRLENQIKLLEDRISKKTVRAPYDGFVVQEYVHRGMWVQIGGRVVRMARLQPIYVTVPLPQQYLSRIRTGEEALVQVYERANTTLSGKISAIIRRGDSASRTFRVKVALPNPDNILNPGMLAYVTLRAGDDRRVLTVSKDAVVITPDQKRLVFVVEDGKVQPVPVTTGNASESSVEVNGKGLKEGQAVVTVGNERLRPGQRVKVIGPLRKSSKSFSQSNPTIQDTASP